MHLLRPPPSERMQKRGLVSSALLSTDDLWQASAGLAMHNKVIEPDSPLSQSSPLPTGTGQCRRSAHRVGAHVTVHVNMCQVSICLPASGVADDCSVTVCCTSRDLLIAAQS